MSIWWVSGLIALGWFVVVGLIVALCLSCFREDE